MSGPISRLIEDPLAFVQKHTAHPTRVVGINNIALDEYPRKAVREALVNAFAHRDYARLRVPTDVRGFVPPSVEAQLNDRRSRLWWRYRRKER